MRLDILKSKHGYRIISYTANKHPLLILLAELLKVSNKISPVKCGIYSVSSAEFKLTKRVYSYLADRTEHMNKKKFHKWMRGEVAMKAKKPWAKQLKLSRKESAEINEMFSAV